MYLICIIIMVLIEDHLVHNIDIIFILIGCNIFIWYVFIYNTLNNLYINIFFVFIYIYKYIHIHISHSKDPMLMIQCHFHLLVCYIQHVQCRRNLKIICVLLIYGIWLILIAEQHKNQLKVTHSVISTNG